MAFRCDRCRVPAEEDRDVQLAVRTGEYPDVDAVVRDDGTFNEDAGTYRCIPCYMQSGQPGRLAEDGGWISSTPHPREEDAA